MAGGTRFDDAALNATYQRYLATATIREVDVDAVEADLEPWFTHALFADPVTRLGAYRGIDRLGALTLAAEVCDWRRFATAGGFMSFCGLVPSEYSSGDRTRRGHLTRAGNVHVRTQLVESAWAYNHPARITKAIERATTAFPPRPWRAPGRRSNGCVGASASSTNARTSARSSTPPSPPTLSVSWGQECLNRSPTRGVVFRGGPAPALPPRPAHPPPPNDPPPFWATRPPPREQTQGGHFLLDPPPGFPQTVEASTMRSGDARDTKEVRPRVP